MAAAGREQARVEVVEGRGAEDMEAVRAEEAREEEDLVAVAMAAEVRAEVMVGGERAAAETVAVAMAQE